jgi:hypothetical protein
MVSSGFTQNPLRFIARPYSVTEGDAVIFSYLADKSTVPLSQIKSWRWDFDGDVAASALPSDPGWDVQKAVGGSVTADQINTSWRAAFNAAKGTGTTNLRNYRPRLQITKADNTLVQNAVAGVTEDVGPQLDTVADSTFAVRLRGTEDDTITVNFYGNPRVARLIQGSPETSTQEIKFFAEVSFKRGVTARIINYAWDLNGSGGLEVTTNLGDVSGVDKRDINARLESVTGVNANYVYTGLPTLGRIRYNVSLKVEYEVDTTTNGNPTTLTQWSPVVTKLDFLTIENNPESLTMGRSYRVGFPEQYGWDDVIQSYSSAGAGGNRYVYFNLLEDAFIEQYGDLVANPSQANPYLANSAGLYLAESVNELLQGQTLRGLQGMINALRIRYPRLVDPNTVPERLPAPAGARDETAELERAALDFSQSTQYAAFAIRAYGPGILRPVPDPTKIAPYPQFPHYLTFEDSTLSGAPIPVKNEYWQLSGAADGQAQARIEKAKLLWRYSLQDATALPEAKEETKVAATQSYLMMALMANGQTENQFAQNEGNSLMAHVRIATDLFDKISAGVNPLGNDGSFIPNESFAAIYQDAQDAVTDARTAEIEAREEKRTFDRNQADLRNELLSQRNSYITPLKLLTGIDPAGYNNLQTVTDQKDFRNTFTSRLTHLVNNYPNADPTGLGEYGAQVAALFEANLNVGDQITNLNNLYESIKRASKK